MAKKVALVNMKGGVGKSTLAVNLAWQFAGLSMWVKNVLVVDLDPQFNASQYLLGKKRYEEEVYREKSPTVWNVFEQLTRTPGADNRPALEPDRVIKRVVSYVSGNHLDLIPSQLELAYSLRNPGQKEQLLRKLISKVENDYDLVVLDCAPTESVLTTAAYLASDYVLVPVKPDFLSSIGLPLLVKSIGEFRAQFDGHTLDLAGIVFNATSDYSPEETQSKEEVKRVAADYGWYVFDSEIRFSRSYPKGAREGRPIFTTSYSRSEQANRFHAFAREFAERIDL